MVVALCALAGSAHGQAPHLGPSVIVNPPQDPDDPVYRYFETAIAVSPLSPYQLVVACKRTSDIDVAAVLYGISGSSSGPSFPSTQVGLLPSDTCGYPDNGDDPMVAASTATGDLWIGAMKDGPSGFHVNRKAFGVNALASSTSTQILCDTAHAWDKGFLAVGPRPGDAGSSDPLTMYQVMRENITGSTRGDCPSTEQNYLRCLESDYSSTSTPGVSWTATSILPITDDTTNFPCGVSGTGAAPVVTANGYLVVAYRPYACGNLARLPSSVIYSTDRGASWQPHVALNRAYLTSSTTEDVGDVADPQGTMTDRNFPGICGDPRSGHRNDVWVVFTGTFESTGTSNPDLVIAHGVYDSGSSILVFNSDNTLHLKDSDLGLPAFSGNVQLYPWIAVDQDGGVNLIYTMITGLNYTGDPYNPILRTFYTRIGNFSVPLGSSPDISTQPLTGYFFGRVAPFSYPAPNSPVNYLGEYQMITANGCTLYAGFTSTEADSNSVQSYNLRVRRIDLQSGSCAVAADVNQDGTVDGEDAVLFAGAYIAGEPLADVNHDQAVNLSDWACFQTSYACGCNP